ncbi:hypothetical protein SAMN05428934_10816 [Tessaracoccus flavus]|uniref:hypothetical protein n=1 Tax=Tessaracoccus flavus TaxID=1610493 RepID=UPI0008956CCF|nr:hypothetical protein [Tessaracoccus flavus]SDZ01213.1 hypothetical protein SAMN05428934_10816 [Tessaracoccus flavus]
MRPGTAAVLAGLVLTGCAVAPAPSAEPVTPEPAPSTSLFQPSVPPTSSPTPGRASATPVPEPAVPEPTETDESPARPSTSAPATTAVSPSAPPVPNPAPSTTAVAPDPAVPSGWRSFDADLLSAGDVGGIEGAPSGFADYVVARFADEDSAGCLLSAMTVTSVHPAGYVYGSENGSCGGSATLYAEVGGVWGVALAMQAMPECSALREAGIPEGLGIRCGHETGDREY